MGRRRKISRRREPKKGSYGIVRSEREKEEKVEKEKEEDNIAPVNKKSK